MKERVKHLVDLMPEQQLDALLVSTPENRRYLSGFTGSAGYLLISADQAMLFTDSRYTQQARDQSPDFEVVQVSRGWDWLMEALKDSGVQRLGFESENITVASYNSLTKTWKGEKSLSGTTLVATSGLVEKLRVIKDAEEVTLLQKAINASDAAMDAACSTLEEGMTEREVAWRMEAAMREFGADSTSFNTIVASGPNGAMPHHRPTERPIRQGEPVVIDMGARVGGYCSDITRTVVVGEPDETFNKIYDIVLGAQLTAISIVQAGMTGAECDSLSRVVIEHASYGDNFGHGLGHGVGLAVHESPRVGPVSTERLDLNMVFTIEPGIYLPGWGGVRIEDIVILEKEGARPLSKARK
jgi:Xaa-Pro aminopeptidase